MKREPRTLLICLSLLLALTAVTGARAQHKPLPEPVLPAKKAN